MRYQVVAREKVEKDIGEGRTSMKEVEVKVGDPEKYQSDAETHAQTLREMFIKMGRGQVEIAVVSVE